MFVGEYDLLEEELRDEEGVRLLFCRLERPRLSELDPLLLLEYDAPLEVDDDEEEDIDVTEGDPLVPDDEEE